MLYLFYHCFSSPRNSGFSWDSWRQLDHLNILHCHIHTCLNFGGYDNPLPAKVNKSFFFHYIEIAKRKSKQDSLLPDKGAS